MPLDKVLGPKERQNITIELSICMNDDGVNTAQISKRKRIYKYKQLVNQLCEFKSCKSRERRQSEQM